MEVFKYIRFHKQENLDLVMISAVLGLMFTFTYYRFETVFEPFLYTFFVFFFFFAILLITRMIVMKILSFFEGFEILLKQTSLDHYWIRPYDSISSLKRTAAGAPSDFSSDVLNPHFPETFPKKPSLVSEKFRGFPSSIISLVVFIFLLGYFIFPALWRYSFKKIPHRFFGRVSIHEVEETSLLPMQVTGYRFSKVLIGGFFYYVIFAIILKFLFLDSNSSLFTWLFGITFYIAIFGLIPIPGTEGFDLWHCSRLAWFFSITIVFLGMLSVIVFSSLFYMLLVLVLSTIMVMVVYLWRTLM